MNMHKANIEETDGDFLPRETADVIPQSLDGSGAAQFLESLGYEVEHYRELGGGSYALTTCGIALANNGFCRHHKKLG